MNNAQLQLAFEVRKPVDMVFRCLTDPETFVKVHPIITRMDSRQDGTFRVHETIKLFGFIPYSFQYDAVIEPNQPENSVHVQATVMKMTNIDMQFQLVDRGSATLVKEVISFRSPLPIGWVLKGLFRKTHEQLFKNIEQVA